jgi:hypothetical protein
MKSDTKIDSEIELKYEYRDEINDKIRGLKRDYSDNLGSKLEILKELDGNFSNLHLVQSSVKKVYDETENECFQRNAIDVLQLVSELEEFTKYS